MPETKEIFLARLKGISEHWKQNNFNMCFTMSIDLTKLSWTFELKNELFMSEILESVFRNIDNTQNDFRVKIIKSKEIDMRVKITSHIDTLITQYEKYDFAACIETLKEIRYIATLYQLNLAYNLNRDEQ